MNDSAITESQKKSAPLLALPAVAYTKSGIAFAPNEDHWRFVDGAHKVDLNFKKLKHLGQNVRNSFKRTLLWYLQSKSPRFAQNLFNHTLAFDKWATANYSEPAQEITQYHIVSYYS
ncbi:hypothetical protein ACNSPR_30925 [Klebsiella pneumoniae]